MQIELMPKEKPSIIKVIGVGGGGSNAVNHMYKQGIRGVEFVVCNTDAQALDISPVPTKIQLGSNLTEGRGAGSIPEVGKQSAIENIDDIKKVLNETTKMVFITAGMGGGTGTGAAPIIASVAREMGILTVGIVTIPFAFEGKKRKQQAEAGIEEFKRNVDTLLIICNDRLRMIHGNLKLNEAFSHADNILSTAAKSIAEIISVTLHINVDFADVQTVMKDSGVAIMGSAQASGENRAITAVEAALDSPLLNDNNIEGARYILLNITSGNTEVTMDEMGEITDYIQEKAGQTAEVIMGVGIDETLDDRIGVTLIATGFKSKQQLYDDNAKKPEKIVYDLNATPSPDYDNPERGKKLQSKDEPSIRTVEEELPVTSVYNFNRSKDDTKTDNGFSLKHIEKVILPKVKEMVESPFDNKEDFLKNITQPVHDDVVIKNEVQLEDVAPAPLVNEIVAELPEAKVEELVVGPIAEVTVVENTVEEIAKPVAEVLAIEEEPVIANIIQVEDLNEIVVATENVMAIESELTVDEIIDATPVTETEEPSVLIEENFIPVAEEAVPSVEMIEAEMVNTEITELAASIYSENKEEPVAEVVQEITIEAVIDPVIEMISEPVVEVSVVETSEIVAEGTAEPVAEVKSEETPITEAKAEEIIMEAPNVFEFTNIPQPINSSSILTDEKIEEEEPTIDEVTAKVVEEEKIEEIQLRVVEKTPEPVMIKREFTPEEKPISSAPAVTEDDIFKRTRERLEKLKQLSYRMSSPNNIVEMEKEPAYKRRGVQLGDVKPSTDEGNISRVSLDNDANNKPSLNSNNKFLHDKAD
ncbi:MAG: cell division protein FtsZ [Bacteroidetes bacterium]|nr:cell division protein FtsZ [Bacteroidota bacterium]